MSDKTYDRLVFGAAFAFMAICLAILLMAAIEAAL